MEKATIESEKTNKNVLKFTFDGAGKEDTVETLNRFYRECNDKDYGKKVTVSDIIARGLRKLDLKDIELLQEQSMGLKDSLRQKYKEEKGIEGSEDDFVRWLITEYSSQKQKKRALQ